MPFAKTPTPPYFAVIFSNQHRPGGRPGYAEAAARMEELAQQEDGYLGLESATEGNRSITISYWRDETSILAWKQNLEHAAARERGRKEWYAKYVTRVAKVERDYSFEHVQSE